MTQSIHFVGEAVNGFEDRARVLDRESRGATFTFDITGFPTDLVGTLGVVILNTDGTVATARSTANIVERADDATGEVVEKVETQPVVIFGCTALTEWASAFTENLAKAAAEQGVQEPQTNRQQRRASDKSKSSSARKAILWRQGDK